MPHSILILAEHDNARLAPSTPRLLTAAGEIGGGVDLLIAGHGSCAVAEAAAQAPGVQRVLWADGPGMTGFPAETMAALLSDLGKGYDHVLAPASTFGRNILPRAAALLDCAPVTDVVRIDGPETFVRPIHAGAALETLLCREPTKLLTIRPTAFEAAPMTGGNATTESLPIPLPARRSRFVESWLSDSERPELTEARVAIAGGQGMETRENFQLLEELADQLSAAVGGSRAAVDAGFVPNDRQIGQTGKIIAPELYIAVGISGATQHLAGIKESRVIVAINKDPQAPIFSFADYGLEADARSAISELTEKLKNLG